MHLYGELSKRRDVRQPVVVHPNKLDDQHYDIKSKQTCLKICKHKQTKNNLTKIVFINVSHGIVTQPIKGLRDTIKYIVYVDNSILNT